MSQTNTHAPPTRLFNRDFITFQIIVFLVSTSFNMTMPNMSGAAMKLGATGTLMGLAASGFAIVALLTRPITSPMANLLNKKKQYRVALLLYVLCYLGYSVSHNIIVLIAFRCVQGFALGMVVTNAATLSSFYIPESEIPKGLGIYAIVDVGSMAAGPYLGLWLVNNLGYTACFLAAAALAATALALTVLIRDVDGKKAQSGIIALIKKPRLNQFFSLECLTPTAAMCLFAFAYSGISSFLALIAASKGIGNIGAFFTVYAVTTMLMRPAAQMFGKRFGQSSLIVPCGLLFVAGLFFCATASSLIMYMLAAFLMGMGNGSVSVVLLIICTQRVPASQRGLANGTFYLGTDMGFGIGPVVGGAIAGAFGYSVMMYLLIVPVLLAIAISIFGKKNMAPLAEAPKEEDRLLAG